MNKKKIVGIQRIAPKNKNPFYFLFVEFPMEAGSNGTGVCCDRIFVPDNKMLPDLKVNDYVVIGFNANSYVDFIMKV